MPLEVILVHNIFGLFLYYLATFAPVNVGCKLMSGYIINYISEHFKTWTNIFQQMTSLELQQNKLQTHETINSAVIV